MPDNLFNSPLFQQGRALAGQLGPDKTQSLLQQIMASGAVGSGVMAPGLMSPMPQPTNMGTASTDPGPAHSQIQSLMDQSIGGIRQPAGSSFIRTPAQRGFLHIPHAPMNRSDVNPALEEQGSDVEKLRAIADKQQANIGDGPNLSALASYVDHIAGTNYAQSYKSPEAKQMEVAKLRSMAASGDNSLAKLQTQLAIASQRSNDAYLRTVASKGSQTSYDLNPKDLDRDTQKFSIQMNELKDARNNVANIAQAEIKAARLAALMDRYKTGDQLKDNELNELATGVASLLTGNNGVVGHEQIKSLAPYALGKDYNHIVAYIMSHPEQSNLGEWVELLGNTVHSERKTAEDQMAQNKKRVASGFQSLYDDKNRGQRNVYNIGRLNGYTRKEMDEMFDVDGPVAEKGLVHAGAPGGFYTGTVVPNAEANLRSMGAGSGAPGGFKGDWNSLSPAGKKAYLEHHQGN